MTEVAGLSRQGGRVEPLVQGRVGADGADDTSRSVSREIAAMLSTRGIHATLGHLNARTRYRFTAIYAVEGEVLRNLELYDRENPGLRLGGGVCLLEESYCAFIAATSTAFTTTDSRHDERVRAHARRDTVLSYAGVPIRSSGGRVAGTLCHYDPRPRLVPAGELSVLEAAARVLGEWLRAEGTAADRGA